MNGRRAVLVSTAGAIAAWAVLTEWIVPVLVTDGYAGRGLAIANRFFAPKRALHPLEYYLTRVRECTFGGALLLTLSGALAWWLLDRERSAVALRRLAGHATPEALAACRVVVVTVAFGCVAWEDLPSSALLPRSMFQFAGQGLMSLVASLPGYSALLASAQALLVFKIALLGVLAFALVGVATRVSIALGCAGYLVYGGILRQYSHFFHAELLPLYLLALLALTPCGDAFSVDRALRIRRGAPVPPLGEACARYGLSRWALLAVIGLCYFSAGLSKLRNGGLLWWDPDNLRATVAASALDPMQLDFPFGLALVHAPDGLVAAMAIAALLIECGMLAVLWSARARRILPLGVWCLHVGIALTQNILFPDLLVLPLLFFEPERLLRRLAHFARGALPAEPPAVRVASATSVALELRLLVPLTVYACATLAQVEWYPFTTWQMFSERNTTTRIEYVRLRAQRADGQEVDARIERDIGALWDTRHRDLIGAFLGEHDSASRTTLAELLGVACRVHNQRAADGERVVGYSVERWAWDFRRAPEDPLHGERLELHRFADPDACGVP